MNYDSELRVCDEELFTFRTCTCTKATSRSNSSIVFLGVLTIEHFNQRGAASCSEMSVCFAKFIHEVCACCISPIWLPAVSELFCSDESNSLQTRVLFIKHRGGGGYSVRPRDSSSSRRRVTQLHQSREQVIQEVSAGMTPAGEADWRVLKTRPHGRSMVEPNVTNLCPSSRTSPSCMRRPGTTS